MDVMYLDRKPVLHIVDEGTRFSAARFVPDVSRKTIWRTFLECWAAGYTGLPHKILVDQANYFGPVFATIGALSRVDVSEPVPKPTPASGSTNVITSLFGPPSGS